jgi:DNA-binding transcriptional LysR family regulator
MAISESSIPKSGKIMDRFGAMTVLLAVVDHGSFSAASRILRMPLPTVSRRIAELETALHARLLTRSTRRLALTDAGRHYVDACRRILDDVADAERAAAGEYRAPRGELVVAAPVVFGRLFVQPLLNEFLRAYPDIAVRADYADRIVNLDEEHVDVALRIGAAPDGSLVAVPVGGSRIVACASPEYLARRGTPIDPGQLPGHDCIAFDGLVSPRAWTFADGASVGVRVRLVVNSADAAIAAARAGLGIVRALSYQVDAAVRAGELALVLEHHEPAPRPINLLYAGHRRVPLKLRAFVDFSRPRLREALGYSGRS